MSRGGRGGGRGGSMKRNRPEWEAGQVLDSKPSPLFPPYKIPTAAPTTDREKREVEYYLRLREQIHQSSLYTKSSTQTKTSKTYGEEQFNNQYHHRSKTDIDPFVGVPRYSEKYEPKARTIPQLTGPFNKELFPKELWSTLDGEDGEAVRAGINRAIKKRAALFSTTDPLTGTQKTQSLEDKIKSATEDVDVDSEAEREEDEIPEEERDYDYDDDDDEMAGDYNGEQYFDGGDNEDDDDGDGGGDAY